MKRLIIIVNILGIFSTHNFATEISYEKKEAAKLVIRLYGYTCDYVNSISSFILSNGYNVYCNDYSYGYEIKNKGGKWLVIVK